MSLSDYDRVNLMLTFSVSSLSLTYQNSMPPKSLNHFCLLKYLLSFSLFKSTKIWLRNYLSGD